MTAAGEERGELVSSRVLDAPVGLVWSAFTTPAHIAAFWAGGSAVVVPGSVVVDLRVGGGFQLDVAARGGAATTKRGVYLDIDEPHRIVFTEPDTRITTTLTLTAQGSRTELMVHQTDVPPALCTPQAEAGLADMLRRLDAHLTDVNRKENRDDGRDHARHRRCGPAEP